MKAFAACVAGVTLPFATLAAATAGPVPLPELVRQVAIPHQDFTLANGLRVFVITDRKAPIVAVSIWYHIGSKDEPATETGFAHLYEHLMFGGSENAPGSYFQPMQQIGATDMNGSTWFDRTNYFETVPTGALPRTLFLESDRMGHLLGAIDQTKLDTQRGVVQNEKRQGDNQPYGLVRYAQDAALSPPSHPYHHPVIGSMADLDAASLDTVKSWFRKNYGPNNAVLVLAGDIDVATAKPMVEKYFGDIPRGPAVNPAAADVPTLAARKQAMLKDRVATTRLYRDWYVPGFASADLPALDVAASIFGGLASSRLDTALVRGEKVAVGVTAGVEPRERLSQFEITVDVKPGIDPGVVSKRLDALIADYLKNGPTEDEVKRAVTSEVAGRIRGLESVGGFGGKAVTIAEGVLYAGDPDFYAKDLAAYAALTPAKVTAAAAHWLGRPVYALTVEPGQRDAYAEATAGKARATAAPGPPPPASKRETAARTAPALGPIADLKFPTIEHVRLSNGMAVDYARRPDQPITRLSLAFDAGNAADPKDKLGLQSFLLRLLNEGTATRSAIQIAEEKERLGAQISAGPGMDWTDVDLFALTPNLTPSLDLFADVVQHPAFAPAEVERVRAQQLAGIADEMTEPESLALRLLPPMIYGTAHPYGVPFSGSGAPDAVARVTHDDMELFRRAWLRPDNGRFFVVSDRPLAEILPLLEARFGRWQATGPKGVKALDAPVADAGGSRIVLVNQPDSPQSLILGGQVTPRLGTEDIVPLVAANAVLGGDFLSRMNVDLRETKHYTYGVGSAISTVVGRMPYLIFAPVQADQTGASIASLITDMTDYLGPKPTQPTELERVVNGRIRALPGRFETSSAVLGAMEGDAMLHRPDDYWDRLPARYRSLTTSELDKQIRQTIAPDKLLWVVVGDAKTVKPQLDKLGLPLSVVDGSTTGGRK